MSSKDEPIDVDDAIDQLSDEALVCRDLQHSWVPKDAHEIPGGGYVRILRCRSCTTKRVEYLDGWGSVVRRYYQYADGYLIKGVGRFAGEYKDRARLINVMGMAERTAKAELKAAEKKIRDASN